MDLKDYKQNKLEDSELESILGGTDIIEEDAIFLVDSDFIIEDMLEGF